MKNNLVTTGLDTQIVYLLACRHALEHSVQFTDVVISEIMCAIHRIKTIYLKRMLEDTQMAIKYRPIRNSHKRSSWEKFAIDIEEHIKQRGE